MHIVRYHQQLFTMQKPCLTTLTPTMPVLSAGLNEPSAGTPASTADFVLEVDDIVRFLSQMPEMRRQIRIMRRLP